MASEHTTDSIVVLRRSLLIANKSKIKTIQTVSEIIFILLDFVRSFFNYDCLLFGIEVRFNIYC